MQKSSFNPSILWPGLLIILGSAIICAAFSEQAEIFLANVKDYPKGRTVREFILGVTLVPSLFVLLRMTIFGNGAIWTDQHVDLLLVEG